VNGDNILSLVKSVRETRKKVHRYEMFHSTPSVKAQYLNDKTKFIIEQFNLPISEDCVQVSGKRALSRVVLFGTN
jgi:hypothetical protein